MITELHKNNGEKIYYNEDTNVKFVWDNRIKFNPIIEALVKTSKEPEVKKQPHSLRGFLSIFDK